MYCCVLVLYSKQYSATHLILSTLYTMMEKCVRKHHRNVSSSFILFWIFYPWNAAIACCAMCEWCDFVVFLFCLLVFFKKKTKYVRIFANHWTIWFFHSWKNRILFYCQIGSIAQWAILNGHTRCEKIIIVMYVSDKLYS